MISVASNLFPRKIGEICNLYFEGRHRESYQKQLEALPLIRALFAETNPTPVKYAMSRLALCSEDVRLPLAPATAATRAAVDTALDAYREN